MNDEISLQIENKIAKSNNVRSLLHSKTLLLMSINLLKVYQPTFIVIAGYLKIGFSGNQKSNNEMGSRHSEDLFLFNSSKFLSSLKNFQSFRDFKKLRQIHLV